MSDTDDDEFARYLASYLADYSYRFIAEDRVGAYVKEEYLYELIKEFRQELP